MDSPSPDPFGSSPLSHRPGRQLSSPAATKQPDDGVGVDDNDLDDDDEGAPPFPAGRRVGARDRAIDSSAAANASSTERSMTLALRLRVEDAVSPPLCLGSLRSSIGRELDASDTPLGLSSSIGSGVQTRHGVTTSALKKSAKVRTSNSNPFGNVRLDTLSTVWSSIDRDDSVGLRQTTWRRRAGE